MTDYSPNKKPGDCLGRLIAIVLVATASSAGAATIAVTAAADLDGSPGLAVTMDGSTAPAYVWDDSPANETVYSASFLINRNDLDMVAPNNHSILMAFQENASPPHQPVIRLTMGRFADGRFFIRAFAMQDTGNFRFIGGTILTAATAKIGIEWKRSDPGADNGVLRLYRNDVLQQERLDIKNETLGGQPAGIDHVRLGAPSLIDTNSTGTYYIDSFLSYRTEAFQ